MTHGLSNDDWGSEEWPEPDFDDETVAYGYDAERDDAYMPAPILGEYEDALSAPSLPVILFSTLFGLAGGIIGLYVAYAVLDLGVELSAGIATFCMLMCLGTTGAVVSSLAGVRSAPVNILFSCGLVLVGILFLVCCALCGAVTASLLIGV